MAPVESIEWEVPVDADLKCTEFKPFKFYGPLLLPHCGRRRTTNPHMRAFWASTLGFMLAFIGWFAFAPLLAVVRVDIGLCDNDAEIQLLPEGERVDACVCKEECKATIGSANIAAVSFDVFTRFILGSVIERFGPAKTDCMLLSFGALVVAASAAVTSGPGLIAVRFFVSCLGSTFVVNQFWNSIMFSKSVVGTANATAGGWGNLGGGLTQILMPLIYRFWKDAVGLSLSAAWRAAMCVPATMYVILVVWIFTCSQDTTTGSFDVAVLGKRNRAGLGDYLRVLSDYRVVLMIFQYSACFGCELVLNNFLATHFKDNFGVDIVAAGALAMSFGGMNLFARSLGGIASDWANTRWQMQGRLWTHFLSLLGQAVFLFAFGCVDAATGGWPLALVNEVAEARARLAAKFGKAQLGGKGTQRRVQKKTPHNAQAAVSEDKKLKAAIKKFGVQPFNDIEEVNMFKDDNTVVHFRRPAVQFSVRENLLSVVGQPESKEMKDLLPDILKQVGPQQYGFLKDLIDKSGGLGGKGGAAADADEDDVPPLVDGNFETAAK